MDDASRVSFGYVEVVYDLEGEYPFGDAGISVHREFGYPWIDGRCFAGVLRRYL